MRGPNHPPAKPVEESASRLGAGANSKNVGRRSGGEAVRVQTGGGEGFRLSNKVTVAQIFRKTSVVSAGLISYKRARLRPLFESRKLVTQSPFVSRSVAIGPVGR